MDTEYLRIFIPRERALAQGHPYYGHEDYPVGAELLALLSDADRQFIIDHISRGRLPYGDRHTPLCVDPPANALQVATALRDRRQQFEDHTRMYAQWVDQYCTSAQKSRFIAGCLAENEVLDQVRDHLLPPVGLYVPLQKEDVTCRAGKITFTSSVVDPKENGQRWNAQRTQDWLSALHVVIASSDRLEIELREHIAKCECCGASAIRFGIRAWCEWAGRVITRDYAI